MADLDNFFAKKDRKKVKGKKFATSSDNVATSQEEFQKKQEKQKKERSLIHQNYTNENDKNSMNPEEEWNDYSEEVKDYTTLKMQNLTTECSSNYADNNEKDDEIEFEENDNGEMVPKKKNVGPWKVPEPEYIPPPIPKVLEKSVEVGEKVYIPPAQRNNFQGGHRSTPKSKTSLDVKNEDMFPTLQPNSSKKTLTSAKKADTVAWSKYQ